jgi:hypothetical protein
VNRQGPAGRLVGNRCPTPPTQKSECDFRAKKRRAGAWMRKETPNQRVFMKLLEYC